MIWSALILFFGDVLNWAFSALPRVTALPTLGGFNLDTNLLNAVGYFKHMITYFPPFGVVFDAFMFYMAFKITLLTLRLLRIIR